MGYVFKVNGYATSPREYKAKTGHVFLSRGHILQFSKLQGEGIPPTFGGGDTTDKDKKPKKFAAGEGWVSVPGKEPLQKSTPEKTYLYSVEKEQLTGKFKDGKVFWSIKGNIIDVDSGKPVEVDEVNTANAGAVETGKTEKILTDIYTVLIEILTSLKNAPKVVTNAPKMVAQKEKQLLVLDVCAARAADEAAMAQQQEDHFGAPPVEELPPDDEVPF
jgi:hypothetical protein